MTWEKLVAFFAKHCEFLDRALTLIETAGFKVKLENCRVSPQRVPFVGHLVRGSEDPKKVSAVNSW